jgi:hypothetical protein
METWSSCADAILAERQWIDANWGVHLRKRRRASARAARHAAMVKPCWVDIADSIRHPQLEEVPGESPLPAEPEDAPPMPPMALPPMPPTPLPDPPDPTNSPDDELLVVVGGASMHCPVSQVCPGGHVTPVHASTHVPALQIVPAAHIMPTHVVSTQLPLTMSQLSPVPQGRHAQEAMQTPFTHTNPEPHVTPAQSSTHLSALHVCPAGQTTPAQAARHLPSLHTSPGPHVTPLQTSAMQTSPWQRKLGGQGNSPDSHDSTQVP